MQLQSAEIQVHAQEMTRLRNELEAEARARAALRDRLYGLGIESVVTSYHDGSGHAVASTNASRALLPPSPSSELEALRREQRGMRASVRQLHANVSHEIDRRL